MSHQKLPQLLASLPQDGLHALVRPATWPPHQFYKITKSKLRFRDTASAAGAGETAGETSENGRLKVFGKAWGMLYRNGNLQKSSESPLAKPSSPIRGALKHSWILHSPSTIPEDQRKAILESEKVMRDLEKVRSERIRESRVRRLDRLKANKEAKMGQVEEAENA